MQIMKEEWEDGSQSVWAWTVEDFNYSGHVAFIRREREFVTQEQLIAARLTQKNLTKLSD